MFGVKQNGKKAFIGTIFFVLVFSFFLNGSLERTIVFAADGETTTGAEPLDVYEAQKEDNKAATNNKGPGLAAVTDAKKGDSCVLNPIKCLLYGVLTFCAFLASVAAAIFLYVLDVSHLQAIMSNAVIYEMWRIVRDFFNLFFIFALLLVAFSTIFQVSKYGGLKSVWSIVLAALFINFSFPIARMVIDVGNVMMYSLINDIFGMTAASLNDGILGTAGLKAIFIPENRFNSDLDVKFYLIAIVGMFMFGVSFLTLALMMFYRLFMLPILVMFSPIGFAGSAIPGMGGYASQWWDKLIKNVFFGPIAVFMMMIAVQFMRVLIASNIAGNKAANTAGLTADKVSSDFLASIVYMVIPIIFFWIAITSAEKLSSEASGMANSFGSKLIKWTGAKYSGWNAAKRFGSSYSAERKKREDHKLQNGWMVKYGKGLGQTQNKLTDQAHGTLRRGDKWYSGVPGSAGARERLKALQDKEIAEKVKEHKEKYTDEKTLMEKVRGSDPVEAAAAAIALAEGKKIDGATKLAAVLRAAGNDPSRVEMILEKISGTGALRNMKDADYTAMVGNISMQFKGNDDLISSMKKKLDNQMKKDGHGQVLVNSLIGQVDPNNADTPGALYNHEAAYKEIMGKMSVEELGKQNIVDAADENFIQFARSRSVKTRNSILTNDKISENIKAAWESVGTTLDTASTDAIETTKKVSNLREKLKEVAQRNGRR